MQWEENKQANERFVQTLHLRYVDAKEVHEKIIQ